MSKIIDIDVIIDTATIETNYGGGGSATAPKDIGHNDLYMIAPKVVVISGQATGDLNINALVNDGIRWRSESLSGNTDQAAVIYQIDRFGGTQVTTTPQMVVSYPPTPIPNPDSPTSYTANDQQADTFLNCSVISKGTENYRVWFYIVNKDPNTGALSTFGYYRWDPTITVNA
jgi:hypothetical protein